LLDEIGELPLELQPTLLRVLQDGEFERVGGGQTIKSKVRLIAATNRELENLIERAVITSPEGNLQIELPTPSGFHPDKTLSL
jgi:transcriptional regulator with GAF, ATPase, and Fis domain